MHVVVGVINCEKMHDYIASVHKYFHDQDRIWLCTTQVQRRVLRKLIHQVTSLVLDYIVSSAVVDPCSVA